MHFSNYLLHSGFTSRIGIIRSGVLAKRELLSIFVRERTELTEQERTWHT